MLTRSIFLAVVLLLFDYEGVLAQDTELTTILAGKDDTVKVMKLWSYAKTLVSTDSKKATELFKVVVRLSRQLNFDDGVGRGLLYLGNSELDAGRYERAKENYKSAFHSFTLAHDSLGIASCLNDLGITYNALGNTDSTIWYYMKAVPILERIHHFQMLARVYQNLGNVIINNLEEDNKDGIERTLFYYRKAEEAARISSDTLALVSVKCNLSAAYTNTDYGAALAFADEALQLLKGINNNRSLSRAWDRKADALRLLQRDQEALQSSERAIKYAQLASDVDLYFFALLTQAKIFGNMHDYGKEIYVLEKALLKCKEVGNVLHFQNIYELLSDANYNSGNYRHAYDYLVKSNVFKDSSLNESNNRLIAALEVKYQTSKKEKALSEKQVQLMQKDIQIQTNKTYMVYSIVSLAVALLLAFGLYLYMHYKKRTHTRALKSMQQQKELQLLQALMQGEEKERSRIAKELHDGVAGMLAAVKMHFSSIMADDLLVQTEGYQQGMKLLNEATLEIRKTSHNLMPEVLLQHGLDEAIRRYCNSVNNSKTLSIQYDSWGEVNRFIDGFELSVYRIVQELINNIIKHSEATQAIVQVAQQDNILTISIEDNGKGFNNDNLTTAGMGLRNLQARVKAMNGKIELESTPKTGVTAYLEFEVEDLKNEVGLHHE